jgi:hypothetical protein
LRLFRPNANSQRWPQNKRKSLPLIMHKQAIKRARMPNSARHRTCGCWHGQIRRKIASLESRPFAFGGFSVSIC